MNYEFDEDMIDDFNDEKDDEIDIEISQPEKIDRLLKEMQSTIDKTLSKVEYNFAVVQNPNYVHDKEFRLGFLRSERYNARNAASRMVRTTVNVRVCVSLCEIFCIAKSTAYESTIFRCLDEH